MELPSASLPPDLAVRYRAMRRLRTFDEALLRLSREGDLRGSLHLATGQEALPVGWGAAVGPNDVFTGTYRNHGYVLARGIDLRRVLAEILGRSEGLNGGAGGKQHLIALEHGLLGLNGIVAAGVPIAVGGAWSRRQQGLDCVGWTIFGDGAMNQGVFWEALTLAKLFRVPVVFVCENNGYAEMTPSRHMAPVWPLRDRLVGTGIPAEVVDGNDVVAVERFLTKLRHEIDGPFFVEAETYRMAGHYQADSAAYRPEGELESWQARDPLARIASHLADEVIQTITNEVNQEIDDAVAWARSVSLPRRSA